MFSCILEHRSRRAASPRPRLETVRDEHDEGAIERLYREEAPRLARRLGARLSPGEEAADLVQDAFARLIASGTFSRLRTPQAFLHRIVRNLLIDRARSLKARGPHLLVDEAGLSIAPDQVDTLEVKEMRELYSRAVDALPRRTRQVFLLHRVDGLCYREIAGALGISVRTVEWHMAEALVRIGKELEQ